MQISEKSGQPSITTLSSYDEAPTPRSSRSREAYVDVSPKQVEGPRGPHLFRSSVSQSLREEDAVLSMSPMTPKAVKGPAMTPSVLLPQAPPLPRRSSPFQYTHQDLEPSSLASWSPEMVAQSMLDAGIELSVADRFIENDINGSILATLKFEDLKELDIASFGIRTKVWHQIQHLRDTRPTSPSPPTPIEEWPSRAARREAKQDETSLQRHQSRQRRQRHKPSGDEITPAESVSIIGIEQVIPKAHHCSKGENCSKWKRQQRLLAHLKRANPDVGIQTGRNIMIVGDAGNPETAKALDPDATLRPSSNALASVVASSDVLGPGGLPPLQYLQEATLRNVQARDPQDNVRQFLDFQQGNSNDVPPTPPYAVHAHPRPPCQSIQRLPRLSIPATTAVSSRRTSTASSQSQSRPQQAADERDPADDATPKVDPTSPPSWETPKNPYRFASPFSEMDVPVTAVPIGPVARDASQSVPPDMSYRVASPVLNPSRQSRSASRSSRRPSFPILPALDEDKPVRMSRSPPTKTSPRASLRPQRATQAPPRVQYPWSPTERPTWEQAIPPTDGATAEEPPESGANADGITHQGPMRKRRMRMLRHEWHDGYFTLKGTRLNMHKDAERLDRTLEYVDIDDYAIACSSLASQSKLSAAFKAVSISHNREKSDPVGAFSFQLIPQDRDKTSARLRKRDPTPRVGQIQEEGFNGTGKTHHFAVKSRDDRIDWMRELMLAKAMKRKGEGFEVSVNGNMI